MNWFDLEIWEDLEWKWEHCMRLNRYNYIITGTQDCRKIKETQKMPVLPARRITGSGTLCIKAVYRKLELQILCSNWSCTNQYISLYVHCTDCFHLYYLNTIMAQKRMKLSLYWQFWLALPPLPFSHTHFNSFRHIGTLSIELYQFTIVPHSLFSLIYFVVYITAAPSEAVLAYAILQFCINVYSNP